MMRTKSDRSGSCSCEAPSHHAFIPSGRPKVILFVGIQDLFVFRLSSHNFRQPRFEKYGEENIRFLAGTWQHWW